MVVSTNFWPAPLIFVWLIGIVFAVCRWRRHPGVSATVLISMGLALVAAIGHTTAFAALDRDLPVVASLVRAAGLATMLVAVFGWRQPASGATTRIPLQFSILGLLVLTLVVAILCVLIRGLIAALDEYSFILLSLLDDIPMAICWLFGGWLAGARHAEQPQVSRCTALAIGLQIASLLVTVGVTAYMLRFGPAAFPRSASTLVPLVCGPLSWALMLAAAFGWRSVASRAANVTS
jgi:hypothetical protein